MQRSFRLIPLIVLFVVVATGLAHHLPQARSEAETPPLTELDFNAFRSRVAPPHHGDAPLAPPQLLPPTGPRADDHLLVITHGRLIDGTGAAPLAGGTVVIRGNRIIAVGPASSVTIPANATVIDVSGQTILPGIINSHVHFAYDPLTRRNFLVEGVTSVCDLATSLRVMSNFEREFTTTQEPAARGFKVGPMLTVPGGYPSTIHNFSWHYAVATPAEAQAAVEDLVARGVDVIKVALEPGAPDQPWPVLTPAQVQAIVTTAHARGKLVRVHVRQAAMLDRALAAGVDVIEHTPLPFCLERELRSVLQAGDLHLDRQPRFKAQLARMAAQGVTLVPTLDPHTWVIGQLPGLTAAERAAAVDFTLKTIAYFREMGGIVALGNDYGNPGVVEHLPLREMELLLQAGLSPLEVIEAGTRHAAYVSGHGAELGTLEAGKLADLIVVAGDPLTDIRALERVRLVVKGGEVVYLQDEPL